MSEHLKNVKYLAIHVANISPHGRFADPEHHPIRWTAIVATIGIFILYITA